VASAFAHAAVAAAIGSLTLPDRTPRSCWIAGVACAVLPDVDVLAFRFGIPYEHVLGHRGLTHSLAFAAVMAGAAALIVRRAVPPGQWSRVLAFLFLAGASHGVLDALTNGGLGVAFFAPFDATRYFFPWRPIEVSPIGVQPFFTRRGWAVIGSEAGWVFLPSAVVTLAAFWMRSRRRRNAAAPESGASR
jgi:inner membrane protein